MNQTDEVPFYWIESSYVFLTALFSKLTSLFSGITLLLYMLLYFPVFPIFVYVFRKNRDTEMTSNVFPILNHFYRTTIFNYVFISFIIITVPYRMKPNFETEFPILYLIFLRARDFLTVIFDIHHFILILLAVQRFVLYFELSAKLDLSPKTVHIILFMLYFIGDLKFAIFEVSILVFKNETITLLYPKTLLYESIVIHVLLFASAILYIPISRSIKRKAHLASVIKNKPDRFILYQTIGLAVFKVASLRLFINQIFESHTPEIDGYVGNMYDFGTTPVMIQMSHLFSNKRNFDTVKNIFKGRSLTAPSVPRGESQTLSTRTQPRGLFAGGVNRVAQLAIRSPIV